MKLFWSAVILLLSSPLRAEDAKILPQVQPAPPVPESEIAAPAGTPSSDGALTKEEIGRHNAKVRRCFLDYEPIKNRVRLRVSIGPDGMIGSPFDILSAVDSDQFWRDVKTALKKVHQCEPFIVEPLSKTKGNRYVQIFDFAAKEFDSEVRKAIFEHLKCVNRHETGPEIVVELKFKPDGTYEERPHLVEPLDTPEYLKAAAVITDSLTRCPPALMPAEKFWQWQTFKWHFRSAEGIAENEKRDTQATTNQEKR